MSKLRKGKQPIIMIADHDEDERALLKAILKLIGFRVVEAWDAPQATRLTQLTSPDVIVLDLTLPGLGGRDGLQRLRSQAASPHLPIIAVSMDEAHRRIGQSTAFVSKPIEHEQLYSLIRRFLTAKRHGSRNRSSMLPKRISAGKIHAI
jgi:CheY-like chemotaxis protein